VDNTVEPWGGGGEFLLCVFGQELRLGTLPSLPKVVGSRLAARPNVTARPKTLPKGAKNVGSSCPTGPNSVGFG